MVYICFNDNIILAGGREIACLFLSDFLLYLLMVERCSVDEKNFFFAQ